MCLQLGKEVENIENVRKLEKNATQMRIIIKFINGIQNTNKEKKIFQAIRTCLLYIM